MRVSASPGVGWQAMLSAAGVEFPCGGEGTCGGCRVRVIEGTLAVTPEMERVLSARELAGGWRLACCATLDGPVVLEAGEAAVPVLGDDVPLAGAAEAGGITGTGIAIDLGTTTLVAQALDLASGEVLAVRTDLNSQGLHGADIMTRIGFALSGGAGALSVSIREQLGRMLPAPARLVLLAGNTAMHHLFCGIDVTPLAAVPFQPVGDGEQVFTPRELGWDLPDEAEVRFLPCLGGFVGSDVLAGVIATGIAESPSLQALIDLGTNGEIVLGNAGRMLCASTAAGPAFEAGRIRMGMRASAGAIAHVFRRGGALECRTVDDRPARGIAGSGLVDAVAAGLESGAILPNGRMPRGELVLEPPVRLYQSDVRELQLAKAAIAAGLRILAGRWGATIGDIQRIYLAGAFGNYVRVESARRIGLLEMDAARVVPAGNTALRGVKMALVAPSRRDDWIQRIRARVEHVSLASDPGFQDTFVDCMAFPGPSQNTRGQCA